MFLYQIYTKELGLYRIAEHGLTNLEFPNMPIGAYLRRDYIDIWHHRTHEGWELVETESLPSRLRMLLLITPEKEE